MALTIDERSVRPTSKEQWQLARLRALQHFDEQRTEGDEDPRTTPDPNSPNRVQIADAQILHLSTLVHELVQLWRGPEHDEYGRLRPTQAAFDAAIELLVDAAIIVHFERRQIPLGNVSTDSEGGVRIEWVRDAVSVHLVVPASGCDAAYVYHEVGREYATEDATPERLSHWLRTVA